MNDQLRVSCAVLIFDKIAGQDHILYGYKWCAPGGGVGYEFPGGRHDSGETLKETASREVLEETGLIVSEPRFITYLQHGLWLCMLFSAFPVDGALELREPSKHRDWTWFPVNEPPIGVIGYCQKAIAKIYGAPGQ